MVERDRRIIWRSSSEVERAGGVAERQPYVGAVVARLSEVRLQPQGFVEEDLRRRQVALFGDDSAHGVPRHGVGGVGLDGRAQHLDRLVGPVLIANRAGEVVGAFGMVGMGGEEVAEEFFGLRLHAHAEGQAAQVVRHLRMRGQEGQRRFVAGDRGGEVAGALAGDGQQVPAISAAFVLFERLNGELGAQFEVARLQRRHRAAQEGFDGQRLELAEGGVQFLERRLRSRRPHGVGQARLSGARGGARGAERDGRGFARPVRARHGRLHFLRVWGHASRHYA
jgi:hypothetical protein